MKQSYNITVISGNKKTILNAEKGKNLLSALAEGGFYIPASCGGRGRCGKCRVKLTEGGVSGAKAENGYVLSCLAYISGDVTVELNEVTGGGLTQFWGTVTERDSLTGYGVALDIGTTTLAFYLMDLKSGAELDSYSCLNPQGVYGADVISRITACTEGKLPELNRLITQKVNAVINMFKEKHGIKEIDRLTVCGNTTMLHLFANEDASPLGVYPFKPVFTETRVYSGGDIGVNAVSVTLLPSVSAYVGSDITAGIISTRMTENNKNNMLIDIGTNGEIALYTGGRLYCASTAAGPALEGANITWGTGGVKGAIDSAEYNNGKIRYTVIGGGKAEGICGSGLIDIMAAMLEKGVFDETGAFSGLQIPGLREDRYYINDEIYISQKDVREFQLAKSAICAGLKALAAKAGLTLSGIDNLYIAGGLGYYINHKNAVKVGLLPKETANKITVVGNSAGAGAKMCLLSQRQTALCGEAAKSCQNIELSAEELFMEEYINNMAFEIKGQYGQHRHN